MKELDARGETFIKSWKEKRTKKWKYAFVHGSIYWGLPIGIVVFLFNSHLQVEKMFLSKFLIEVVVFMIGGYLHGLYEFKRIDALFWFEDSDVSVEKINECFSLLLSDFQRLRKNSAFDEFSNAFDIRLQVYDNSMVSTPLIDKTI